MERTVRVVKWLITALILVALYLLLAGYARAAEDVRLKDLARIQGAYESSLIGYGLVVGLAGSGDSPRNRATMQSLANTLANFDVRIGEADLNSRNTAAVMVTATLAAFAEQGDRIDIQASSIGDARSLAGGTLLLTPLYGPDRRLYALAQGALAVGGYAVEASASSVQKNYPTVGRVPRGAIVERPTTGGVDTGSSAVSVLLNAPDYTTAQRIAGAIRQADAGLGVRVAHPGKVQVTYGARTDVMGLIARLEALSVTPDYAARVVVNERTGSVVAGANVAIGAVSIAHGDLQIEVVTDFLVSQPNQLIGGGGSAIRTEVVPTSSIHVSESAGGVVELDDAATVGDLVRALRRIHVGPRDVISILQAIRSAGALHADLIIQ